MNKKILIIALVGIIIIYSIYNIVQKDKENEEYNYNEIYINEQSIEQEAEEKIETIKIHISGQVKKEGIIELEKGARIADAIEKAGGLTEKADIKNVNLAYELKDGQKIYIPSINEDNNNEYITQGAGEDILIEGKENNEVININTASQTELETLSGIGPSTALKIVQYREANGDFEKIEDLLNIPGIGESKFEQIKENICV